MAAYQFLQIDSESHYRSKGGRAHRSSSMDTSMDIITDWQKLKLYLQLLSAQCHGQHSPQFDPTACGLGGSESSGALGQHGW